jgi:hypothetical protein
VLETFTQREEPHLCLSAVLVFVARSFASFSFSLSIVAGGGIPATPITINHPSTSMTGPTFLPHSIKCKRKKSPSKAAGRKKKRGRDSWKREWQCLSLRITCVTGVLTLGSYAVRQDNPNRQGVRLADIHRNDLSMMQIRYTDTHTHTHTHMERERETTATSTKAKKRRW